MSFCRVAAAVGCRKLLSATDKQMTTSPCLPTLPQADLQLIVCCSFFICLFVLTIEKDLAGVGVFPS